jgi:hypothetical protein
MAYEIGIVGATPLIGIIGTFRYQSSFPGTVCDRMNSSPAVAQKRPESCVPAFIDHAGQI